MLENIFVGDVKHMINFQRKIIDLCADALMVVDKNGDIIYVNKSFKEVHEVSEEEVLGKPVTSIIDNTRLDVVASNGVAEHDCLQDIKSHSYVVSRVPIFENGKCVGAVGMIRFRHMEEIQKLTEKVKDLTCEIEQLRKSKKASDEAEYTFNHIPGIAPAAKEAKNKAMLAAPRETTVLLRGESGVGKEVYSQSIHNYSPRSEGPFIHLNCSAIPEHLIESELFGYEEGAFTGARKGGHRGMFEQADKGTIFLDEFGDMPLATQVKLLRVIQEGKVSRIGSEKITKIDVRIIAATNQNLEEMIKEKSFREDLFYRLNVFPIELPALRDAVEELPILAKRMWKRMARKNGMFHMHLEDSALGALQQYSWPGNVRELQNFLERCMIMSCENDITAEFVEKALQSGTENDQDLQAASSKQLPLAELIEKTEHEAISFALNASNGNRSEASRRLGITRPLLYKKMARYGLN
eukprot:TRINITY_DN428322_c0_g1_i1.p1 TRINITY_DN428322_c0_g1~~TRINITY_DN428322_c0_g1_i1.p1  ORF type:complete len:467 (-),score=11.89 TRINITY_DN428322_c0_g1_i1:951-2351(-)